MLNALNHLTLAVSNLPVSIAFWRDLLGLRLHAQWHTGAYLTCGDLWLCLSYDETRQLFRRRTAITPTTPSLLNRNTLTPSRKS
jgi:catechol 2,3-dioxygenase-like lactoylglutathione lyase family enzyme